MCEGIFLTEEKSLISFAIISTEWHEEKKDYLDMFIPFCLQCLAEQGHCGNPVSFKKLKSSLKDKYGIRLPSNVIEMILRRLTKRGYIRIDNKVCYLSDKKIDVDSFKDKSEKAERHQRELFSRITNFLKKNYPGFNFEPNKLEDYFIQYLSKYGRGVIVSDEKNQNRQEESIEEEELYNHYIGIFISYAKMNDSKFFSYIKEIIYGAMYAAALHMQQNIKSIQIKSKIEKLIVFLDTPLLLHILGYSGEELRESVFELVEILKNLGVEIRYWQHNIEELTSILEAYEQHYNQGTLDKSRNFEYLVLQKTTPTDISRYKATLSQDLKKMDILLQKDADLNVEEFKICDFFEDYLKRNMFYRSDTKRRNDVNSICYTYHLRSREDFKRIENCEYIFITQNHTLVSLTKPFFRENRNTEEYPAIIDDTLLTSIAWIKSETDGAKILNSKIIADAWAAQSVPPTFWEKCVQEMEKLQNHGDISQEQIYQLEYDFLARRQLYETVEGDASKLNMGDIEQVLHQIEYNKHQELIEDNNKLKQEKLDSEVENDKLSKSLIRSKKKEYLREFGCWKAIAIVRKNLLLILCAVLVGFSQIISFLQSQNLSWKNGKIAIAFAIIIKFIDKALSSRKNSFNDYLLNQSKMQLKKKICSKEQKFSDEIAEEIVENSRLFK